MVLIYGKTGPSKIHVLKPKNGSCSWSLHQALLFYKRNPLFYSCSRICFQIPVFELCKIWIKKSNNYSTTEWFSAKRHKVKHRKSWKLLNWDQLQSDFPSLWMGISSWKVHNIIGKGQTNLPTCAKLILSQPFAQTPGRTKKRQL